MSNWLQELQEVTARRKKYNEGYEAGKQAMRDLLRKGIERFLTDDETEVIISAGEVFVPISAVRKLIK